MPRQRYNIYNDNQQHAYFITCTTIQWLPVFTRAEFCLILTEAWEHYRDHAGLKIFAWVILDNHTHAILSAPDLRKVMRGWKSFTARKVIDQLSEQGQEIRLRELRNLKEFEGRGTQNERVNGELHQLWQSGYHPQIIDSDSLWEQKADYITQNPVKRGLVSRGEDWRFSWAHAWRRDVRPVMRCDPWYPQQPKVY